MGMTQQYLAGELSQILGDVQDIAATEAYARQAWDLRHEAETEPVTALPSVAARALDLTNSLCWESLTRGDAAAFRRQAAVCAELHEFGVCAHLLDDLARETPAAPHNHLLGEAKANGRQNGGTGSRIQ
jgi:hypothetical protein